jgi:hypothetical protein
MHNPNFRKRLRCYIHRSTVVKKNIDILKYILTIFLSTSAPFLRLRQTLSARLCQHLGYLGKARLSRLRLAQNCTAAACQRGYTGAKSTLPALRRPDLRLR